MIINNKKAKVQAQIALNDVWINPTSVVSYRSLGFVLIVSESVQQAQQVSRLLASEFTPYYLVEKTPKHKVNRTNCGFLVALSGYLGSFSVTANIDNKIQNLMVNKKTGKYFDVVIDLTQRIKMPPVPPFGYYVFDSDDDYTAAFAEINQLIGILDKPKYFNLDTVLCVHSRNKTQLCSRCIDACPADAISSNGNSVEVSPNLCHGCGGCSSACPTGAISYAYPTIEDNAKKMHSLVGTYLAHGGQNAQLLFCTVDNQHILASLDNHILPIVLEEVGYLGLESLLYAFCLGVSGVAVHCVDESEKTLKVLQQQINLTHKILHSLKIKNSQSFVQLIDDNIQISQTNITPLINTIDLLELRNKRTRIFAMIDFLWHNRQNQSLLQCEFNNEDAYFGEVIIDKNLCTLCMACVSVCPPEALSSGDINTPIIKFQESLCVQCGLCVKSCPEQAMQLNARLIFDNQQRINKRSLNQDSPFKCVDCGKVFGSTQVVQKMMSKLKNHSMFADGSLNNLEKCEDCRVKALFP